jgi:hypothetical protein
MHGIEDLQHLADYAHLGTLQKYQVAHWILVNPKESFSLGIVAGLVSVPEGQAYTREEIETRKEIFKCLVDEGTVQVFQSIQDISKATGSKDFLVIFLGSSYVLQIFE